MPKVQAKKFKKRGREYRTLYISIPSSLAHALRIKEGDNLEVIVANVRVNGETKQGLFYYKP